jgi:hypothetical protein
MAPMDETASSSSPDVMPTPPDASGAPARDMARHFMDCAALGANLTLAPGERMVITDDILNGGIVGVDALSMAAIVAQDGMVAQAALLPLGIAASRGDGLQRAKYEALFALIEDTAFDTTVRESAEALLHARFRETQIRDLVRELGGVIQPARQRYRAFLDIVRHMAEGRIGEALFLDEFLDFTRAVAGKLDFGIYSLCVDRLFANPRIPLPVKASLLREILKYPPLVRKELVTNLMVSPATPPELVRQARHDVAGVLTHEQQTEILLFSMLKMAWQAQKAVAGRKATG